MNLAFFMLWIVIIVLLIAFCILAAQNVKQINEEQQPFSFDTVTETYCYPNRNIENLPLAPNYCCIYDGVTTPYLKYSFGPDNLNMTLQPNLSVDYLELCKGYCKNYNVLNSVCNDTQTGNPGYYYCIDKLKPIDKCIERSMPIARIGTTPYFARQSSLEQCPRIIEC